MKVRELIERLGAAPPEFEVYIETRERVRPLASATEKRVTSTDLQRRRFWITVSGRANAVVLTPNAGK